MENVGELLKTHSLCELLQLNVRNKSTAGECYIRTEVCLEGWQELSHLSLVSQASIFQCWWITTFLPTCHFLNLEHQHKEAPFSDAKSEKTILQALSCNGYGCDKKRIANPLAQHCEATACKLEYLCEKKWIETTYAINNFILLRLRFLSIVKMVYTAPYELWSQHRFFILGIVQIHLQHTA